jgi:hypothetical protein
MKKRAQETCGTIADAKKDQEEQIDVHFDKYNEKSRIYDPPCSNNHINTTFNCNNHINQTFN